LNVLFFSPPKTTKNLENFFLEGQHDQYSCICAWAFREHADFELLGISYSFNFISIFFKSGGRKTFPFYELGLIAFGTSVTLVKTTVYLCHIEINERKSTNETWRQLIWASTCYPHCTSAGRTSSTKVGRILLNPKSKLFLNPEPDKIKRKS